MKTSRFFAAIAVIITIAASSANAQPKDKGNWRERVMSEKIAFITAELELTPEEAQVFWPVYNQLNAETQKLQQASADAYRALVQALKEGTASDKEIDKLLDEYLAAKQALKESGKGDVNKYRKVLSSKKVAKLYVAEENFRRNHIRDMKSHQGPKGQGHGRPGPGRPAPAR